MQRSSTRRGRPGTELRGRERRRAAQERREAEQRARLVVSSFVCENKKEEKGVSEGAAGHGCAGAQCAAREAAAAAGGEETRGERQQRHDKRKHALLSLRVSSPPLLLASGCAAGRCCSNCNEGGERTERGGGKGKREAEVTDV